MKIAPLAILISTVLTTSAQIVKPPIDTGVFERWPFIENGAISKCAGYASYTIRNEPAGSRTLVIKGLKDGFEYQISGVSNGHFTSDGRFAYFNVKDSLYFLRLVDKRLELLPGIESFQFVSQDAKDFLIYSKKEGAGKIISMRDLATNLDKSFGGVQTFRIDRSEKCVWLSQLVRDKGRPQLCLSRIRFLDFASYLLWSTPDTSANILINNLAFDPANDDIAFAVHERHGMSIWLYQDKTGKAVVLANDSITKYHDELCVEDIAPEGFSHDGKRLFITLKCQRQMPLISGGVGLDVWSYKDDKLQSQQLYEYRHSKGLAESYCAVLQIDNCQIIRLSFDREKMIFMQGAGDSIAFLTKFGKGEFTEKNWNPASQFTFFLISTLNGRRKRVDYSLADRSPFGQYIYGYDQLDHSFGVYDCVSGQLHDLAKSFPPEASIFDLDNEFPGPKPLCLQVAGWITNDRAILLYDKYDIWMVDPRGENAAINITRGYGRAHHLVFRFIGNNSENGSIKTDITYVLSAFNEKTMESGFFSFRIDNAKLPECLTMGPYCFDGPYTSNDGDLLTFSQDVKYLVRRESASQSVNYFTTSDFKKFEPVSLLYPERNYNWLTSEIVHWETSDHVKLMGVLYKPENFNPSKRYPLIINYYERLSQHANEFKRPKYSSDNINIPWYVSRGYIVFTPDIKYKVGHPGESAYQSVVSGTALLLRNRWIDKSKIALQGHSWGGYETNYIITRSDLYCAAVSASSISDLISFYSTLFDDGSSAENFSELGQIRMGATPWGKTDLYVQNSPFLHVNHVHTPLLMMNNRADRLTFPQGLELFTALRRSHKRVWMLQYDGEGHVVSGDAAKDYTIRVAQFIDHYCKGIAAPIWMTKGIPACLKGVDSGLELDHSGTKP